MTDFAVIGGDRRYTMLCDKLISDGKTVSRRDLGARVLVLPVPRDEEIYRSVVDAAGRGQTVLGGQLTKEERSALKEKGVRAGDYMTQESYLVLNAALTAQGAMDILLSEGLRPGMRVLVIGHGRIGRLMALLLERMGVRVHVAARSQTDKAWIRASGWQPEDSLRLEGLGRFERIVNTVPFPVLTRRLLGTVHPQCRILDLASAPYGTDLEAAREKGIPARTAPGLPGLFAPMEAAGILKETIYNILDNPE